MFHKDYKEFIELFVKNKVEYLVVGGHAVIANGYSRLTSDLDLFYRLDIDNAKAILVSIQEFGLGSTGIKLEDLMEQGVINQLGVAPVRIDLVNEIDGVDFDTCFKNKVVLEVYGLAVNFLCFQDLIKNKKASGRNKDLNDIENLP
jgi:hypothetical protein